MTFSTDVAFLEKFSPYIIYEFDPDPDYDDHSPRARWLNSSLERQNLLNAYLFAQKNILPALQKNNDVSSEQWLSWISELHAQCGEHLDKRAGQYREHTMGIFRSPPEVLRDVMGLVAGIVPDSLNSYLNDDSTDPQDTDKLLAKLSEIYNCQPQRKDIIEFFNWAMYIRQSMIQLDLKGYSQKQRFIILTQTSKWIDLQYLNIQLSDEEKRIVEALYTPTSLSTNIAQDMSKFVKNMHRQLLTIDKTSPKEVARCMADIFYQFTAIHPFADANGRTATCLVNVLLASMNYPSIALYQRCGAEKRDPTSTYCRAIRVIQSDRAPLAQLIEERLQYMAANHSPMSSFQQETIERMAFTESVFRIQQLNKNSLRTIEQILQKVEIFLFGVIVPEKNSTMYCMPLKEHISCAIPFLMTLEKPLIATSSSSGLFSKPKQNTHAGITEQLRIIGGVHALDWAYYPKARAALLKNISQENAELIVCAFNNKGLNAEVAKIKGSCELVVKVSDIDRDLLNKKALEESSLASHNASVAAGNALR